MASIMRFKLDEREYSIERDSGKFSLGEQWMLERDYGVSPVTAGEGKNFYGSMLGMFALAYKREHPAQSAAQVKAMIEGLTDEHFELIEVSTDDDEESEADPKGVGTDNADAKTKGTGAKGKTHAKRGNQS